MPAVFVGHGSPMTALEDNDITRGFSAMGEKLLALEPKGVLMVSAHWALRSNRVETQENPTQIYDMYGFPQALYDLKYPAKGCPELAVKVQELLGDDVAADNTWGIDHGTWAPLVHMFPGAPLPITQLSVNTDLSPQEAMNLGKRLAPLRDEGYLVMGSGNVVHNLRMVDWNCEGGSRKTVDFDRKVYEAIEKKDYGSLVKCGKWQDYDYAAPTVEHLLPLFYVIGASDGDDASVFNRTMVLSSMSMTCYAFGLQE